MIGFKETGYSIYGYQVLNARLNSFIEIYNKNKFPIENAKVLGMSNLNIVNQEECLGRIKELVDILQRMIELKEETVKDINGNEIVIKSIKDITDTQVSKDKTLT